MSPPDRDVDVFGDNSDARIISSDDSAEDIHKLVKSDHQAARTLTPDGQIRQEPDGVFGAAVRCPLAVIGLVAGKEQRNLKEICGRYEGLAIEIVKKRTDESAKGATKKSFLDWLDESRCSNINITAPKREVLEKGLKELESRVETAIKRAPFTHLISLPFLENDNQQFMGKIEEFKKEVLANSSTEKECIDESVMVSPKQIHFNLLMLRIYDQKTLDTVAGVLDTFVKAWKEKSKASLPLRLHFKGVYIFDTDRPSKANVVFTHAGIHTSTKGAVTSAGLPQLAPVDDGTEKAKSEGNLETAAQTDNQLNTVVVSNLSRVLNQANTKLKKILAVENQRDLTPEQCAVLSECSDKLGPANEVVKQLLKKVSDNRKRYGRRRESGDAGTDMTSNNAGEGTSNGKGGVDVSTVSGPVVSEIFEMFEIAVKELSQAKVLTDEDRRERRIKRDPSNPNKLTPQSLTLHLTLMSSKWRSASMTRKLQDNRRGGGARGSGAAASSNRSALTRPRPITMDVSKILNNTRDFGEAVISELHLSRRVVSSPGEFIPERVYSLQ